MLRIVKKGKATLETAMLLTEILHLDFFIKINESWTN